MVEIQRATRQLHNAGMLILTPFDPPGPPVRLQMLGAAVLDPGGPRWNELERPRRETVLEWQGRSALRQAVTVMFSGGVSANGDLASVTPQVNQLHELAMPSSGAEPPLLHLEGPAYGNWTGYAWRIETITPGEPRRNGAGEVCQVSYDLGLVRHLFSEVVGISAAKSPAAAAVAAAGGAKAAPTKTYTVMKGDTLSRIAQRVLGSAGRWPEIASLNGLRDPNRLTTGQVLKLPS